MKGINTLKCNENELTHLNYASWVLVAEQAESIDNPMHEAAKRGMNIKPSGFLFPLFVSQTAALYLGNMACYCTFFFN